MLSLQLVPSGRRIGCNKLGLTGISKRRLECRLSPIESDGQFVEVSWFTVWNGRGIAERIGTLDESAEGARHGNERVDIEGFEFCGRHFFVVSMCLFGVGTALLVKRPSADGTLSNGRPESFQRPFDAATRSASRARCSVSWVSCWLAPASADRK